MKMQLLGLLWGPFLSNMNTKKPIKTSKHQQTSEFPLDTFRWDWVLRRSLPVQTGILSYKSPITLLMCAYPLLSTLEGKGITEVFALLMKMLCIHF